MFVCRLVLLSKIVIITQIHNVLICWFSFRILFCFGRRFQQFSNLNKEMCILIQLTLQLTFKISITIELRTYKCKSVCRCLEKHETVI